MTNMLNICPELHIIRYQKICAHRHRYRDQTSDFIYDEHNIVYCGNSIYMIFDICWLYISRLQNRSPLMTKYFAHISSKNVEKISITMAIPNKPINKRKLNSIENMDGKTRKEKGKHSMESNSTSLNLSLARLSTLCFKHREPNPFGFWR